MTNYAELQQFWYTTVEQAGEQAIILLFSFFIIKKILRKKLIYKSIAFMILFIPLCLIDLLDLIKG